MPWKYDPKDAVDCLAEGEYDAELAAVTPKTSKAGNAMLEVTWNVFANGKTWPVRDYIVQPSGLFKLKMIARAWGMADQFNNCTFDLEAHKGKMARLYLTVQSSEGYPDRNGVSGVKAAEHARPAPQPMVPADSEIPF